MPITSTQAQGNEALPRLNLPRIETKAFDGYFWLV
jgi:hypothetical protein